MVARYGEFVRYRPGVDRHTIWLWAAPAGLMCIGVIALAWHFRHRQIASPVPLTAAEQARLEKLLKEPRA
jgi:cytochrome c-type biogenesis protein CcmH